MLFISMRITSLSYDIQYTFQPRAILSYPTLIQTHGGHGHVFQTAL